jgi:curved DNA-binding protein CbpA
MEYAQALRNRYFGATREENGKMLDEFTKVTGLHRKAARDEEVKARYRELVRKLHPDTSSVEGTAFFFQMVLAPLFASYSPLSDSKV